MIKTAFVFPGQGSQSVGMLANFIPHYLQISDTFNEASSAIGYDLWKLVQEGPEDKLNQTEYTQAAMLTADVAIFRLLQDHKIPAPNIMAGHSLGEYAALVCANALSLIDGVRLVAQRGHIMQNAIPLGTGAMAAIVGLTDEHVNELCKQASDAKQQVSPANYNAIGQIVVAGDTKAVEQLITLADTAGARLAKIIPVSVPCHCPLLLDAAELFAESLAKIDFKTPDIEVVSNVDLSIYTSPQHIRDKLKEQLYSPVRWVETIQLFKMKGIESVVECGPSKVLSGLIKRIDRDFNILNINDAVSYETFIAQLPIPA